MSYQIVISGHVDSEEAEAGVLAEAREFAQSLDGVVTATASSQYAGTVDLMENPNQKAPAEE